jgi:hypothetical protein
MADFWGMQVKEGNLRPIFKYDSKAGRALLADKDAYGQPQVSEVPNGKGVGDRFRPV